MRRSLVLLVCLVGCAREPATEPATVTAKKPQDPPAPARKPMPEPAPPAKPEPPPKKEPPPARIALAEMCRVEAANPLAAKKYVGMLVEFRNCRVGTISEGRSITLALYPDEPNHYLTAAFDKSHEAVLSKLVVGQSRINVRGTVALINAPAPYPQSGGYVGLVHCELSP